MLQLLLRTSNPARDAQCGCVTEKIHANEYFHKEIRGIGVVKETPAWDRCCGVSRSRLGYSKPGRGLYAKTQRSTFHRQLEKCIVLPNGNPLTLVSVPSAGFDQSSCWTDALLKSCVSPASSLITRGSGTAESGLLSTVRLDRRRYLFHATSAGIINAVVRQKPRFLYGWCIGIGEHWPIFLAAYMIFALSPAGQ